MNIEVRSVAAAPIEIEGCDTIPKLFEHQVRDARRRGPPFARSASASGGPRRGSEYGDFAKWTGLGLVSLGPAARRSGLDPGRDDARMALCRHGHHGGGRRLQRHLSRPTAAKQVEYILNDSRSRFLFVENEEQLDKYLEVRERCPQIRKVIVFDTEGLTAFRDPQVLTFDELMALGRDHDAANPGLWEKLVGGSKAEELALLVYTSGTTGPPKGAMLSHRNVLFQLGNADAFIPMREAVEQLAFLPLCHVAERTFTVFLPLRSGAIANFAESIETVPDNVREVAPTVFFAVPRIWERFYSSIAIRMKEATWIGRLAYGWAMRIGLKVAETRLSGPQALRAACR